MIYRVGEGTAHGAIGQVNLRGLNGQLTPNICRNIHAQGVHDLFTIIYYIYALCLYKDLNERYAAEHPQRLSVN